MRTYMVRRFIFAWFLVVRLLFQFLPSPAAPLPQAMFFGQNWSATNALVQGCIKPGQNAVQTCTFGAGTTTGNFVVVGIDIEDTSGKTLSSVVNGTNICTISANSPFVVAHPAVGQLYFYGCPQTGSSSTVVVTFSGNASAVYTIYGEELKNRSGFDQTPAGNGGTSSVITTNTAITTYAAETLFAITIASGTYPVVDTSPFYIPKSCPTPSTSCLQVSNNIETLHQADVNITGTYGLVTSSSQSGWGALLVSIY